jgi:hypothetical protein
MLTASVKAGKANCISASCSAVMPAHGGDDDLDGFGRVFAEDVGAEDGVAGAAGDELAEAVGVAVCHRAQEVVVVCIPMAVS